MKNLIAATTLAVVMASGSAFAQTLPEAPPAELAPQAPASEVPGPPPGEANVESDRTRTDRRVERRREKEMRRQLRDARDDHHGRHHWRKRHQGAHLSVRLDEDGSMRFSAQCAADEPMQACADILIQLMDRVDNGTGAAAAEPAPQQ